MFLLPSNLSGSWLPHLSTLGIPLRSWQPFSETADEARGSGDPSESRFEAILRQSRPLSSFPDFGNIIIRLLGSKEESDVANSIAKMTRKRTPGYFHLYARWNQPQHFEARGISSRGARRGARACGVCFNCGKRGHFQKKLYFFLSHC